MDVMTATPLEKKAPPDLKSLLLKEWSSSQGRWRVAGLACASAMIILLYWENLKHFTFVWSNDDNYSHGWLVVPLSLFFANQAAQRAGFKPTPLNPSGSGVLLGLGLVLFGLACRMITVFLPVGLVADGSLILCLAGVIALIYGTGTLRKYSFALGFLLFMIPLPVALYTMLANPLQQIVSKVASILMTTAGIPVLCEGNMMTLPGDIRMFVAEACSGMRQLTGFLALTAAVAYLSGKPLWYRTVLILSAIPVAMIANIARVIVTGLVMYYVDPNYAQGAWHTAEGMLLMVAGLALLQLEMSFLNLIMDVFTEQPATTRKPAAEPQRGTIVTGAQA